MARLSQEPPPLRAILAALALLVLALALRLPHGELAEWKGDEAVQFFHARAIARDHVLPSRGLPTTDGPRLPVHFLYVLSVPVFFSDDPEAIRVWIALLSSATIVSVFWFGKKDLGARPALAWAFLLAVLPDEVRRGRWSWNPNLIPPLAAITVLLLVRARRRPHGWAGGGLLAFSTLLPLIHYSLVGLGGLSFVWGLGWSRNRRASLVGAILGLLLLAPHVIIESRTGFQATRGAFAVAGAKPDDPERRPLTFPRLAFEAFAIESYARAAGTEPLAFEGPVSWAVKALVLVGVGLGAWGAGSSIQRKFVALSRRSSEGGGGRGGERREGAGADADSGVDAENFQRNVGTFQGNEPGFQRNERNEPTFHGKIPTFQRKLDAPAIALLAALAAWAPFLLLRLPARHHYVQTAFPALAYLAAFAVTRVKVLPLVLLPIGWASVLSVATVLGFAAHGLIQGGSDYDLPYFAKKRAVAELLDRELELVQYPRLEYLVVLEAAYRELPPEKRARFEIARTTIGYWDLDVAIPRPKERRGRAAIYVVGTEAVLGVR